jgi:hypothetical protein
MVVSLEYNRSSPWRMMSCQGDRMLRTEMFGGFVQRMQSFLSLTLLLCATSVFAQSSDRQEPFVVVAAGYAIVVDRDEVDLTFPITSQESFPICCVEVARTLYMQYACRLNKTLDCATIGDEFVPSVISMGALAAEGAEVQTRKNNPFPLLELGLQYILTQNNKAGTVYAESCYPMRRFRAAYEAPDRSTADRIKLELEAVTRFRAMYDRARALSKRGSETVELAEALQRSFNARRSPEELAVALREKSFERFLHRLLLGSCKQGVAFEADQIDGWSNVAGSNYRDHIRKIRDVLRHGMIVGVSMCLHGQAECVRHCIIVTGYRKVCRAGNHADCKELLHIRNSWGEEWQRVFDDGWVDAKPLLESVSLDDGDGYPEFIYLGHLE